MPYLTNAELEAIIQQRILAALAEDHAKRSAKGGGNGWKAMTPEQQAAKIAKMVQSRKKI